MLCDFIPRRIGEKKMTKQKSEISIKDLEEAAKDLKLKVSQNKYGLRRVMDENFTIAQYRPTKYGFRFYLGGSDNVDKCYRVSEKAQINKLVSAMKKLKNARKVQSDNSILYQVGNFSTKNKSEIINHLLGSL